MDNTIYCVCKYTPMEIFAGFDLPVERLDPAPANFECAESCTHPNLCGYGKALIEEVAGRNIRRLILVDCCDVCRRIYDVLRQQGNMEFLFLLSLPHTNNAASVALLERDLKRLQGELSKLTGGSFDPDKALAAWKKGITEAEAQTLTEPHVRLTGAHGGSLLKEMIQQRMPLPVQDDTCTGRRTLLPAPETWSDTAYATALAAALKAANLTREDIDVVVTTGYGRETIGLSDASATEITCHAKGAHFLFPQARTVIDIGGQDSKVIRIDERGNVVNFVMNDKCAAGTGRFLDMMAKTLELTLPEMSELGLAWKNEVTISSMCTVFAESEVVSLVADNTAPEDIIHGLNASVAGKTASLVKRLGGEPAYIMTGGVAQNKGVVKELSDKLGAEVHVPQEAQLCGAIGAALLAFEER